MSTARILPREEWDRLPEDVAAFCATLNPEDVAPVVVEDAGVIVARLLVMRAPHLESFWIAPEYAGNAGVTRALLRGATEQALQWGPTWVMANAEPGAMCDTLERLGGQWLPVHTFMLPLRKIEEAECRPKSAGPEPKRLCPSAPTTGALPALSAAPLPREEDSLCPLL